MFAQNSYGTITFQKEIAGGQITSFAVVEGLPYAMVEPVSDISPEILERIASLAKIQVSEINVLDSDTLELSSPREPTQKMIEEADGEFIAKLDTLTLKSKFLSDGEPGYYSATKPIDFRKKALVLITGNTGQSLSMWILKTVLSLLLGVCNVSFGGIVILAFGFLVIKSHARKKFFHLP